MEAARGLSGLIRLRDDLIEEDYRLLYLAWLRARSMHDPDDYDDDIEYDDILEPPIPAGLNNLSPSLQYFIRIFDVDWHLIQAAAKKSESLGKVHKIDYSMLVSQLSRSETDSFLVDLAAGKPGTAAALRKRLAAFLPQKKSAPKMKPRSMQQLKKQAIKIEEEERKRRAEAARKKHVAEMKSLAQREEQAWEAVDQLLANSRKIASVYDNATAQLKKLAQLADFKDTRSVFQSRIQSLAEKYAGRNALIGRWKREGWL